jgi:hypothetical protein
VAIKTYRFDAPVHDQFQLAAGELVFGGQEVELEESLALDPRLTLVEGAVEEAQEEEEPATEQTTQGFSQGSGSKK